MPVNRVSLRGAGLQYAAAAQGNNVKENGNDLHIGRQALTQLVADSYPQLAHSLLRPLLDLLSVSRQACGGDVDKFLIMLVVAVRTTEHRLFATFTQEQLLSGEIAVFPSLGTNVRSVAESTGVPKETIRRKVSDLIEAGWIVRNGNDLYFTAFAYQQLAGVRIAIEQLAVRDFEAIAELIRRQ